MSDLLTHEQRSNLMSKVRSKDTKPEWVLRSALHRLGFRYTLNNSKLPGKPDLVLAKYKTAVFVNGCFWHRHPNCKKSTIPKTNREFWQTKLERNVQRDQQSYQALRDLGWTVVVVWECELYQQTLDSIGKVVAAIEGAAPTSASGGARFGALSEDEILRVAEQKVRYRIDRVKVPAGKE